MLDLFAGELGWGAVFAARGWQVTAVDLKRPRREIPKGVEFVQMDVLKMRFNQQPIPHFNAVGDEPNPFWEWCVPDFICVSSPCEDFAVWGMRHFHKDPPFPHLGIRLFTHALVLCEQSGAPYILENVRVAQRFVGLADAHAGSFYLWGKGIPPLLPAKLRKGFRHKEMFAHDRTNRTRVSATIPPELANCVAEYAERLLAVSA